MRKLGLSLSIVLVLGMVLAVSCGGGAAPAPTVTVTKTAPPVTVTVGATPGAAPTVTVTQTAPAVPAVTVTVTFTPAPPKLVKVRDVEPEGGTNSFVMLVGQAQGFFEKRGVDLEVKEMAVSASKVAPFLGQANTASGETLAFYPERKDVRIIGPSINTPHSLMVRKESSYQSYRDLKGKKIGITGPASGQYQVAKVLTKLEGLDLEKDFQLVIGAASVQTGWLLKGEVEAIHLNEPLTSKLLVSDGDKVRELFRFNDLYKKHTGTSWSIDGMYTTDAWVKANPELARQVGLAYDDTLSYIYAHDQVWKGDLAKKQWRVEDPKVLEVLVERMPALVEHPRYGPAYKAALIKRVRLIADAGLVPQEAVDWYKGTILFADD